MPVSKPFPLFPTYDELKDVRLDDFPELNTYLEKSDKWKRNAWHWGQEFLSYIGRNKSQHTYTRFRSELEKFLLWSFLVSDKPIDELRKSDILAYADFFWQPPLNWICFVNHEKYRFSNGVFEINPEWAPFRLVQAKGDQSKPDKKLYRPSQQTLHAMFTALNAFYKHMMDEEICYGNPVQVAKKDCKYFIKDAQVKDVKRLSEDQWQYLLDVAEKMANDDSKYERNLFLIASLKTLFLRISEFSERADWVPTMGHFWKDNDDNWWLKVYGKGRKLRDVTVPPSFIPYLKRYRASRGLNSLPVLGETHPIIAKIRGRNGMTARQLSRLVQEIFDQAFEAMRLSHGEEAAARFQQVSTHWLRHTGASLEIERGRALKDVSEDLGHASMATTDTIYVQTENKKRAESGKSRDV
ncbi:MAG: site-specific integrase [Oleiphilaceae bacterium]|nr:site-specific integrase [Oleiphilaceae bacterium]